MPGACSASCLSEPRRSSELCETCQQPRAECEHCRGARKEPSASFCRACHTSPAERAPGPHPPLPAPRHPQPASHRSLVSGCFDMWSLSTFFLSFSALPPTPRESRAASGAVRVSRNGGSSPPSCSWYSWRLMQFVLASVAGTGGLWVSPMLGLTLPWSDGSFPAHEWGAFFKRLGTTGQKKTDAVLGVEKPPISILPLCVFCSY